MKKSTIKRRKRVVPAYPEASPTEAPRSQPATSASPEPLSDADEQTETTSEGPATKRRRPPPPIDFTDYDPGATTKDDAQSSARDQAAVADYARQAQLAAAAAEHGRVDLALREGSNADADRKKMERRAQLLREAEAMRAALRAKEKEIDDLQ